MTVPARRRTARSLAAVAAGCALVGGIACAPAPAASQSAPGLAPKGGGLFAGFDRAVDAFPISDSAGRPFAFPLLGGLDRPRPQLVDIDADGDLDLFVQEYGGQMMFFERVAAADGRPARYAWRTDRWRGLDVGEWSRFVDVDGDGDQDLLAESPYSFVRWHRNDGGRARASFTVAADTVKDADGRPIFADRQNIPQVTDLDCNGRLDLMLGRVDGTITRYEMRTLDPARGPLFGLVTERFEGIQIIGGDAVQTAPVQGNVPGNAPVSPVVPGPTRHGANTMAITDVDGDGDPDILWGDFFEPGLLLIRNNGTCPAPQMRETPAPFPIGAPLRTSGYNAPTVGDLDGDGDLDLLVGVLGGAYDPSLTSRDNLFKLEQTAPGRYAVRSSRFLDGLDVGNESSPALADLDGDGDLDLLLGNKIDPGSSASGSLQHFENVGTRSAPAFRARGRIPVAAAFHLAPALGDLDGDGDPDLVLGTWRDALLYFRNEGTRVAPKFVLADSALLTLTRGSHAAPSLADLDGDGDLDLLVGEASGSVNYYRNDGTPAAARFTLVSDEWEGIAGGRRSAPRAADVDGDGDLDLVVGNESGNPLVYRNTGSARAPSFSRETAPVDWPPLGTPAFGDLDGDGDSDALLGTASGGLIHLRNPAR